MHTGISDLGLSGMNEIPSDKKPGHIKLMPTTERQDFPPDKSRVPIEMESIAIR